MPIVHINFRRLYHISLIMLHFADHSMYRYCFFFFFNCLYYTFMFIVTVYDSACSYVTVL